MRDNHTDALRSNVDAAESKHVVLGLLLLQYISNAPGIGCVKGLCHIVE